MFTSSSFAVYIKGLELKFNKRVVGVCSEHDQYFNKSCYSDEFHLGKPTWSFAFLPMALEGP
jgi:hypothetical protein